MDFYAVLDAVLELLQRHKRVTYRALKRQFELDDAYLEDLKAEIALLFSQMENQPEDRHELYLQIREKLNEMRAFGLPLPDDLVRLEKELEAEFKAEERPAKKH